MKKLLYILLILPLLFICSCEEEIEEAGESEQTFYFATEESIAGSTWTAYFPEDWSQDVQYPLDNSPMAQQWSFHFVSLNQIEMSEKTADGVIIEGWVENVMWVGNKMYIDQDIGSYNFMTLNGYNFIHEQHEDDGSMTYITFHPH